MTTTTKPVRFNVESKTAGLLKFTYCDDWTTATTTYTVTGPRISGSLITRPVPGSGPSLDLDTPLLSVVLGSRGGEGPYIRRDDPLTVNTIALMASTTVNIHDVVDTNNRYWGMYFRRAAAYGTLEPGVPEATAIRALTVVRAAVRHWLWRDDSADLRRLAAAIQAHKPSNRHHHVEAVEVAQKHYDTWKGRLRQATEDLDIFDQHARDLAPYLPKNPNSYE